MSDDSKTITVSLPTFYYVAQLDYIEISYVAGHDNDFFKRNGLKKWD